MERAGMGWFAKMRIWGLVRVLRIARGSGGRFGETWNCGFARVARVARGSWGRFGETWIQSFARVLPRSGVAGCRAGATADLARRWWPAAGWRGGGTAA
jgi:hypothetical protein